MLFALILGLLARRGLVLESSTARTQQIHHHLEHRLAGRQAGMVALGEQTIPALQLVTGNRDWAEVLPSLSAVRARRLLIFSEPADRSLYPPSPEYAWLGWTSVQHRGLS